MKPGQQLWKLRKSNGAHPRYTPEELWEKSCEYFQWVEDNPLWEVKSYMYLGQPVQDRVPKMRAMTLDGLSIFLGYHIDALFKMSRKDAYREVLDTIRAVMREQKFAGAAADLFNASIIARDLGMKEVHIHEHTGADGGPIASITATLDPVEASRRYRELLVAPVKQIE